MKPTGKYGIVRRMEMFFCRLRAYFAALSVLFLFFSCADGTKQNASDETPETLRYTVETLRDSVGWTEELEGGRLSKNISSYPGVSSQLRLAPLVVAAARVDDDERIFPSLEGFGSLDTTLIPGALRKMLCDFSDAFIQDRDADSFFRAGQTYSLALFYADFSRIFSDVLVHDDGRTADFEKNEDAQEEAGKDVLFNSYLFGQPFLSGTYYQVPVRYNGEKGSLTVFVYAAQFDSRWQIDQIQIDSWDIF